MAPVESTPSGGRHGPQDRWVRSRQEIEDNLDILGALVDGMKASPDRTAADLTYAERYTLGIRAAARWSLGVVDQAPLTGVDAPADVERVAGEIAVADFLVAGGGAASGPAAGVRAWLTWLTGASPRLEFMTG